MARRAIRLFAAALALSAPAALAADYPFSGYFTSQEIDRPPDETQLACAFGFFRQDLDGAFTAYVIDRDRYQRDRTLRYLEYSRGRCAIDWTGKVETCTMSASVDASEVGQSYYDVMGTRTADWVKISYFDTLTAAKLYATVGSGTPAAEIRISRCIGFDAAKLAPYLSEEKTTLSSDERGELLSPDVNAETRPVMMTILQIINGTR